MATQIKLRRDTDTNWTTNSTVVLGDGEIGVNLTNGQFKLGNGTSTWAELLYFQPGTGGGSLTVITPEDFEVQDVTTLAFAGAGVSVDRIDDITTVTIPGGSTIAERSIVFPEGASGDTRGSIVLTPDGETYICVADYQEPIEPTFTVAHTNEDFGQSDPITGRVQLVVDLRDYPELLSFIQSTETSVGDTSVSADDGATWLEVRSYTGLSWEQNPPFLSVEFISVDTPTDEQEFLIKFPATVSAIWKRIVDITADNGNGQFNLATPGDLTIEVTRPEGYDPEGDCDLNLYAADDVWIEAVGDQVTLTAATNVRIYTNGNDDEDGGGWIFGEDNSLTLPGDVVVGGVNGGHLIVNADDGENTSVRWYNMPVNETHSIIRTYTGNPDDETDLNRGRIQLTWQNANRSGLRIVSYDRSDEENTVEHEWTFGGDGWLSFPGTFPSGAIGYDSDTGTLQLARSTGVSLYTQAGAWVFGQDGSITFPDDTVQTTAYTGGGSSTVVRQDTAPTAANGTLWFNTQEARMYIKYMDQWVDASPTVLAPPDTDIDVNSITFADATVLTSANNLATFENSTIQEEDGELTSITGNDNVGLSLTSDKWAQLMWVPDTDTVTLGDIQDGGAVYNWAYVDDEGLTIKNKTTENEYEWKFGTNGSLKFPGASDYRIKEDEPGLVVTSELGFAVVTNSIESAKSWIFDNVGGLTLPGGNIISTSSGFGISPAAGGTLTLGTPMNRWVFDDDNGSITFPDNTVQTTAYTGSTVQGEYIYEFNGTNTNLTITNLNFNLLYCKTAVGYGGSDTHNVNLPAGTPGQRLVIVNITVNCTLTVGGAQQVTVTSGPAEFIYTTNDDWVALYGTV